MTAKDIIKKAKSYDNEDIMFELKQTAKYFSSDGNDVDNILTLIVGMANQNGGYIVVGIKDNGKPEGIDIFDKFKQGSKSGIDKFKEEVNNRCLSNISPRINIIIDYYKDEEYEFAWIEIPKKTSIPHAVIKARGLEIEARKYYIKDSHSCRMVTDTQLEWLFNYKNAAQEETHFNIHLTTHSHLAGIPYKIGENDKFVLQPNASLHLAKFLKRINLERISKNEQFASYTQKLLTEILMYSILQTLKPDSGNIHPNAKSLPLPTKKFLLSKEVKDHVDKLFLRIDKKVKLPPNSKVTIEKSQNDVVLLIKNEYIEIKMQLKFLELNKGLSSINPYSQIVFDMYGYDGKRTLHENYETYSFSLTSTITRLFPKIMTQEYYESYKYASYLNKRIKEKWDIDYFMETYPHYRTNYIIEQTLTKLLSELNNEKR